MGYAYVTLEQAVALQQKTVEISGGGSHGALNLGRLESVLQNIQNDAYYPTLLDKLTHLFFCTNEFHCFVDGNKRLSIAICVHMLLLNGYLLSLKRFIHETENISCHVAAGLVDKDLLRELLNAILTENLDQLEELKLRYLIAIDPVLHSLNLNQMVDCDVEHEALKEPK